MMASWSAGAKIIMPLAGSGMGRRRRAGSWAHGTTAPGDFHCNPHVVRDDLLAHWVPVRPRAHAAIWSQITFLQVTVRVVVLPAQNVRREGPSQHCAMEITVWLAVHGDIVNLDQRCGRGRSCSRG